MINKRKENKKILRVISLKERGGFVLILSMVVIVVTIVVLAVGGSNSLLRTYIMKIC